MIFKSFESDLEQDMELIRQYAKAELTPRDVYVCRIVLADNEIDRDGEQFSPGALEKMAALFPGKPGIFDHDWTARGQTARIYRAKVENAGRANSIGEPFLELTADVYVLRAGNEKLIADIEGGILKEVSVGVSAARPICSICGKPEGTCKHIAGKEYDGKACFFRFEEITDAYEFSFVAVPAQRGAGVRKAYDPSEPADEFIRRLEAGNYDENGRILRAVWNGLRAAVIRDEQRRELIAENEKYLS